MSGGTLTTAQKIKAARHEAGWTQKKLADATGLKQPNIARIERGTSSPTAAVVDRIFAALREAGATTILDSVEGVLGIQGRTDGKLVLVNPMAEPRPVEWLVESFLARRFVTMIAGQEGAGKSSVTQTVAVDLARGHTSSMGMRTHAAFQPATGIKDAYALRGLVIDAENVMVLDESDVDGSLAQSRLQAFGLTEDIKERVQIAGAGGFDLDKDDKALDAILTDMTKAGQGVDYLILDSFTSLWFGNENSVDDVRRVLTKLNRLAVKHDLAILLIHHTNKKGDAYRGTSMIGATIAAVWTFSRMSTRDPETGRKTQHPTARYLAPYKIRMAAEPKSRIVHITATGVQYLPGNNLPNLVNDDEDEETTP